MNEKKKKKAWNIIVIGGAAVSRGITLEGLNVSYFTRLAKLPTSDTLIQMEGGLVIESDMKIYGEFIVPSNFIFYLDNSLMLWKEQELVLNRWQKIEKAQFNLRLRFHACPNQ